MISPRQRQVFTAAGLGTAACDTSRHFHAPACMLRTASCSAHEKSGVQSEDWTPPNEIQTVVHKLSDCESEWLPGVLHDALHVRQHDLAEC